MEYQKEVFELTKEELLHELVARGAQVPEMQRFDFQDKNGTPQRKDIMDRVKAFYRQQARTRAPDESLQHISTPELSKVLLYKIGRISFGDDSARGTWGGDDRQDLFEVEDNGVAANASCVTAICREEDLTDTGDGRMELRVKHYGGTYNLCDCEPFYCQPVAGGLLKSGFLVRENMVVTAAHCVDKGIQNLRFLFGYKMSNPFIPVTRIPKENIYSAAEVLAKRYTTRQANGTDWAVVKLDRNVVGRPVAKLSPEGIYCGQPVYVIGHPVGLPVKYAPGSRVKTIRPTHFIAELDVYSGNSGSPVFDADTHEVVGMVIQGDDIDYIWTGSCYASVVYPVPELNSIGARCTKTSEFFERCV